MAELRSEQADDIRQFVEAILQASFEKKGVPVLHEEAFEKSLLEAIHNIGQVNFKSPDAQVTTLPMWGEAHSVATYGAIADSCDDIIILHQLVFGGNAVYLGYAKLLTAAYTLDGHIQCVLISKQFLNHHRGSVFAPMPAWVVAILCPCWDNMFFIDGVVDFKMKRIE